MRRNGKQKSPHALIKLRVFRFSCQKREINLKRGDFMQIPFNHGNLQLKISIVIFLIGSSKVNMFIYCVIRVCGCKCCHALGIFVIAPGHDMENLITSKWIFNKAAVPQTPVFYLFLFFDNVCIVLS